MNPAGNTRRTRLTSGAAIATLGLALAIPAAAAPSYEAYLYTLANLGFLMYESGPTAPQVASGSLSYGNVFTIVNTVAQTGDLSTHLDVTVYPYVGHGLESGATGAIDDLVITDGTGVPKPVNFYVAVDVAGTASATNYGGLEYTTWITGDLKVAVNGGQRNSHWAPQGGLIQSAYPSDGVFTGISDLAVQGSYLVGPFSVMTQAGNSLQMSSIATVGPNVHMQGICAFDVRLRQSAPAIVLPAGFVANSSQGRIVNSWFVGQNVGVAETEALSPRGLELAPNAPNPFSGSTRIEFALGRPGRVRAEIFSVTGRRVARLLDETRASGRHTVSWDGRDDDGRAAAPGVYLLSLEANGERTTRRITLQR